MCILYISVNVCVPVNIYLYIKHIWDIRWVYKYQYVSNLVELTQTGKHGVKQEIFNNIEHDVYNSKHNIRKKKKTSAVHKNRLMKQ